MQGNCPWLGWCKNKQNIPDSCECRQVLRLWNQTAKGAAYAAYIAVSRDEFIDLFCVVFI
jgi:hypothetical protein